MRAAFWGALDSGVVVRKGVGSWRGRGGSGRWRNLPGRELGRRLLPCVGL